MYLVIDKRRPTRPLTCIAKSLFFKSPMIANGFRTSLGNGDRDFWLVVSWEVMAYLSGLLGSELHCAETKIIAQTELQSLIKEILIIRIRNFCA